MTAKPHILVVEDESIVALDIQNRLRRLGYIVPTTVASGPAALAKAAELQPDLILMDIKLKGEMDGIEAAEQIKARYGIPLIYLTAFADEATLQRAKSTEPLGYLVKPFEELELQATIRMAFYRLQIERRLKDSEQKFRGIIENAMDGIFLVDAKGKIIEWNTTQEIITGLAQTDVLGKFAWDVWYSLLPEKNKAKASANHLKSKILGIIESGHLPDHWRFAETEIQNGDGLLRTLQSRLFIFEREEGNTAGSISRDITERKRFDEAVQQANKIESLGLLAGGAAHDFNNLLVVILGQASLAVAKLAADHPARAHIEKAVQAAQNAADLTQQMLAISGRGKFEVQALQINELIRSEFGLLRAIVPKNAALLLDLSESLPLIEGDRSQLQQILTNLVLNAVEAIGDKKGEIRIGTAVKEISQDDNQLFENLGTTLEPGTYVLISVADDGPGMDRKTRKKVFDPFFSTKRLGRGLGLSAVAGIARGHRGAISVESEPGVGTVFSLLFPQGKDAMKMVENESGEEKNETASNTNAVTSDHVLVIDDQENVLEAAVDILALEEIPVITAAGGQAGVRAYREHEAKIGLVILDLSMPEMDGYETFAALRQINPDVTVILSSGYDEKEVSRRFNGGGLVGFLKKPYNLVTLIETVKQHMRY
jgi:PAS domain S-box-containing protein